MKKNHFLLTLATIFTINLCSGCSFMMPSSSSKFSSSISESSSISVDSSTKKDSSSSSSASDSSASSALHSSNSIQTEKELLKNADFNSLDSWQLYPSNEALLKVNRHGDSLLDVTLNNEGMTDYWGIQILQNGLLLKENENYQISFKIQSSVKRDIRFIIQSDDYKLMPVDQLISLEINQEYCFEYDVKIEKTTSYLFGFMFGNINGTIQGTHQIQIKNPSLLGKKVTSNSHEGLEGTMDTVPTTMKGRSLLWNDEFNGQSLDTNNWVFDIGRGNWGWGNNEQQYYTNRNENIVVSDGSLKIIARKEKYEDANYTSSRITTKGKFDFHYGYAEAKIAVPSMSGIWPAFWMLGANIDERSWPYCGEIDILESVNFNDEVYSTLHWNNGSYPAQYQPTDKGSHTTINDRTQYHIYGFEWDDTFIKTYVDGKVLLEITIVEGNGKECFHNDFYFLLNVAVGGQWPGYNIGDQFPQAMSVDYIRVYQ